MADEDEVQRFAQSIRALERENSILRGRVSQLHQRNQLLEGPLHRIVAERLRTLGDRLTGGGARNLGRRLFAGLARTSAPVKSTDFPTAQLTPEGRYVYFRLAMLVRRSRIRLHEDSN